MTARLPYGDYPWSWEGRDRAQETEIERLRVIIRSVRDALADNDVAGAELVLKNARVDP